MNHPVSESLCKKGNYSKEELTLLESTLELRVLEKDEIILNTNEVCSWVYFLTEGAIYQYKLDSEFDKKVIDLNVPNDWVINHKSFTSRQPSQHIIQAFEKSTVYMLSIEAIHRLIAQSQSFLQMGKILEEATSRVDLFDNDYSPDEKYQHVISNRPQLLHKFPQKLIASYLKMTPETLSRVRSRFSK